MKSKQSNLLIWAPRILGLAFVLFLMVFSLDVFEPGLTPTQIAIGLFMHNIPALILLISLGCAWKYEIIGGVVFILAGLLYISILVTSSSFQWYMLSWSFIIAGPALLIGGLFIAQWIKKKNFLK